MVNLRLITAVAILAANASVALADVELVPGASGPVVVTVSDAPASAQAAYTMAEYLRKGSPANPAVWVGRERAARWDGVRWAPVPDWRYDEAALKAGPAIHVGPTDLALAVLGERVKPLDDDGFIIKTEGNAVLILGKTRRADGFGACAFLEDFCGVRWFLPGELGEDVPFHARLAMPAVDKVYQPAYLHRWPSGRHSDIGPISEWLQRNRLVDRFAFHHNLWRVFDPAKYAADLPDIYPILGGVRRPPRSGVTVGWQPCLSHPRAVEITLAYARECFAANPELGSISIGVNDGGGYCECPECLKVVDASLPQDGQRSRWYFRYANAVAKEVAREFPGKMVGYLGYGQCRFIPPDVRLEPNLIGFYVLPSWSLMLPAGRMKFEAMVENASKNAPRFALYNWYYGSGLVVPALYHDAVQHYLRHGHEKGAIGCYTECYFNWGLDGLKYWVYARLLWDPQQDGRALWREAVTRFYRESAEPMAAFYDLMEKTACEAEPVVVGEDGRLGPAIGQFRRGEHLRPFTPKVLDQGRALLDKARQAARRPLVRRRVDYVSRAFRVTEMAGRSYDAAQQALGLLDRGAPVEDVARALRPGVGPDVDVEQYYRWALDGDRYQVCEPPDTVFAPIAKAQARLAGRLSRQVADALAALANPGPGDLETEMAKVRKRLESALGQEPDLLRLLWRLCGNADRVAFARRAAVAPVIDGRLDDACWQQAATYTAFWVNSSASPARWRTEFSLAFDDANLYCAFRCYQDTQKILVGSSGRDGRVWREDSIELLLNRPDEQDPARYFQFMSNSEGNIFDMLDKNADVNVNAKVGTSVQKDHYVLEWALPFREIGLDPAKDRRLRLNVVRNLYEKKSGRGSQAQTELSNWYLTAGANADLDARGWLFLVER